MTDEEYYELTSLHRPPVIEYQPDAHMLKIFPEAAGAVKRLIKECNSELERLNDRAWRIEEMKLSGIDKIRFLYIMVDHEKALWQAKKDRLQKQLDWLNFRPDPNKTIDLDRIKEIPMENFVRFNSSKFARCVFHEEKTPSMKLYPNNTVYCHSCQRYGDVIEVYGAIHNCVFKEAIKKLSTDYPN